VYCVENCWLGIHDDSFFCTRHFVDTNVFLVQRNMLTIMYANHDILYLSYQGFSIILMKD